MLKKENPSGFYVDPGSLVSDIYILQLYDNKGVCYKTIKYIK